MGPKQSWMMNYWNQLWVVQQVLIQQPLVVVNTKRLQLAVIPQQLWNSQNPYLLNQNPDLQEQNPGLQEQNPDRLMSLQQQQALVKLLRVRIQLLQQHLNSLTNPDLQKIILGNPEIHLPQIHLLNPEFLRLKIQNPDLLQQQLKVRVRSELGPILPKSAHGRMRRTEGKAMLHL